MLDEAVPLEVSAQALARRPFDRARLKELFRELEFHRLLAELTPAARFEAGPQALITTAPELSALIARLAEAGRFVFEPHLRCEAVCPSPVWATLSGLAFATEAEAAYVALGEHPGGAGLPQEEAVALLAPLLADAHAAKVLPSLKTAVLALKLAGVELAGEEIDLGLASYLVNPESHDHSLESIAQERLDMNLAPEANNRSRKAAPPTLAYEAERACARAQAAHLCAAPLAEETRREGLDGLLRGLEMPLARVLADMEAAGVKVDFEAMATMSADFEREMAERQLRIFEMAGEEFNINSAKQLAQVLFEKLRLPLGKRTAKRTAWSTDIEVLAQLAQLHPLPKEVIKFRTLAKLKGTYVDALPRLINPATGRIHTSFNQTVTATGRLSSSEPNLQNIPIKGRLGKKIRRTFVAEEGFRLLAADYSQIELRLLAHLSGDAALAEAFREGADIHTRTAASAFGVHPGLVSEDMRRQAKVINFGIIYGMSAFGLAKELGISRAQAQAYIDRYFERHPGVRDYWERTLTQARERGFVETILGRRRLIPALSSRNLNVRALAERTAINAPLQGSAADIIKRAMIDLHAALKETGLRARLILQVHDELVLEVAEGEVEAASELVREKMTHAVELSVPLLVSMSSGHNWAEAH
jgi:DNA polymerase-1